MPLVFLLAGFFLVKGLLCWPFYYKSGIKPLLLGIISSLAFAPLMAVLYHETEFDFWWVYLFLILADILLYQIILQNKWWKAVLVSVLLNTLVIVYFFIANG